MTNNPRVKRFWCISAIVLLLIINCTQASGVHKKARQLNAVATDTRDDILNNFFTLIAVPTGEDYCITASYTTELAYACIGKRLYQTYGGRTLFTNCTISIEPDLFCLSTIIPESGCLESDNHLRILRAIASNSEYEQCLYDGILGSVSYSNLNPM